MAGAEARFEHRQPDLADKERSSAERFFTFPLRALLFFVVNILFDKRQTFRYNTHQWPGHRGRDAG